MTGKDLLGAMRFVDEQFVDEAENQAILKPANVGWTRWASLAACLCVLLVGLFAVGRFGNAGQGESTVDGITGEENQQEMAQLPASDEISNDIVDEADSSTAVPREAPSVVVRIVSWQEDGFLATVAEIVDTEIFEIGAELAVTFDAETCIAYTEGDQTVYDDRIPTDADFPAGSLVKVQFTAYEEETGTIHAGILSEP